MGADPQVGAVAHACTTVAVAAYPASRIPQHDVMPAQLQRDPRLSRGKESFPCAGILRKARRFADLSQRQLAARVKMHHSVVDRIEAGRHEPSLTLFTELLRAAGVMLVPIDIDTDTPIGTMPDDAMRDAANRYFPAHLDVRRTQGPNSLMWWDWWYYHRGRVKPLATFRRNRNRRDLDRRQDGVTSVTYDERELLALMYPGRRSREPEEEFPIPW